MILLFRPIPPFIEFCKAENDKFSIGKVLLNQGEISKIIDDDAQIEGIGYLLRHGGEVFTDTINILGKDTLDKIEEGIEFSPEYNELTLKVARVFFEKFPAVPQVLFCDTAYFVNLPDEASTYAVPYALRGQGIRRYGADGLIHEWAWGKVKNLRDKSVNKLISIHLGDTPNIAAIKNGNPIETTIGFTDSEGLPSSHGCGDVDPTVVFQLYSKGMSFEGIYDLLSNESGFTGLAGKECRYLDVVAGETASGISQVKQILLYNIIKYIGAFVPLLEGIDALVFVTNHLRQSEKFIREICDSLDFLGLSQENIIELEEPVQEIEKKDPKTKVLCMEQGQLNIMVQDLRKIINREI